MLADCTALFSSTMTEGMFHVTDAFVHAPSHNVWRSISDRTLKYWERATYRPLYLAPEIDDATERGIEWLRGIQSPERAPEDGPDNNSMRLAVRPIEVTRGVIG